jgi:hypothetical protein
MMCGVAVRRLCKVLLWCPRWRRCLNLCRWFGEDRAAWAEEKGDVPAWCGRVLKAGKFLCKLANIVASLLVVPNSSWRFSGIEMGTLKNDSGGRAGSAWYGRKDGVAAAPFTGGRTRCRQPENIELCNFVADGGVVADGRMAANIDGGILVEHICSGVLGSVNRWLLGVIISRTGGGGRQRGGCGISGRFAELSLLVRKWRERK